MLDNIVSIPKNIVIKQEHYSYVYRRYKHYWEYTHNPKFLYLYQKNLKEYYKNIIYINQNYLKGIKYDYIIADSNNSNIYYYKNQTLEDFYNVN